MPNIKEYKMTYLTDQGVKVTLTDHYNDSFVSGTLTASYKGFRNSVKVSGNDFVLASNAISNGDHDTIDRFFAK